jgi:DNA-binding transcriptional LysR family regulator
MLNEIDLSRADLNLLVLFEVVLEEGHVGRAAERLNLSASAVSHGLGRLRRLLNDPLFLRTPKGVVPTARATELAEPIADILARARKVVASAEPFDAARSTRRFTIGAPDGVSAVILPPLLAHLRRAAPRIDISVRELHPDASVLAHLDTRTIDIGVVPLDDIPARFVQRTLYEERFVIAMRAGHPFARAPTLANYCRMLHVLVSLTGDPHGFIDDAISKRGLSRRIAVTAPNFMFALAIVAQTDLVAAVPNRFVSANAGRFGVASRPAPLPLPCSRIRVVAPKVAMMDAGLVWLFEAILVHAQVERPLLKRRQRSR